MSDVLDDKSMMVRNKITLPEGGRETIYTPKYSVVELDSFIDGIRRAATGIREWNPGYHIVSLNGGLALFDILGILDENIDPDLAFYFPGSNKIRNQEAVLTRCFENLFLKKQGAVEGRRPLSSLAEVVGGDSVERLFHAYNAAATNVARHNVIFAGNEARSESIDDDIYVLKNRFPLKVFGIKDMRELGVRMNREYMERLDKGDVMQFPVQRIITRGDPDYETVQFVQEGVDYLPRVERTVITHEYGVLLSDIARRIGASPNRVDPSRLNVISDCERYTKDPELN